MERLNIHGIIDLDQMARLLNEMLERIARQETVIEVLQHQCGTCLASADSLFKATSEVERAISHISERIDALRPLTSIEIEGKRFTAAELSLLNFEHVMHISRELPLYISRTEVEEKLEELGDMRLSNIKLQRNMEKSNTLLDQINKTQLNINNRLASLELSLASKLDKSVFSNVEAAVAKLDFYEDFKSSTIISINSLCEFERNLQPIIRDHGYELKKLSEEAVITEKVLARKSSNDELLALASEVRKLLSTMDSFSPLSTVTEVRNEVNDARSELSLLNSSVQQLLISMKDVIEQQLPSKAPIASLTQFVSRQHYEQAIHALGSEIDRKASTDDAKNIKFQLKETDRRLEEESGKISIALRFVEWFTNRGDAYEHNLRAIDRHLEHLLPQSPAHVSASATSTTPLRSRTDLGLSERRHQISHGYSMVHAQREQLRQMDDIAEEG